MIIAFSVVIVNMHYTGLFTAYSNHIPHVYTKKISMSNIVSFAIGDVVQFTSVGRFNKDKLGTKGIVTDSSVSSGVLQYAVDGNAWIDKDHLALVHRATEETLAKVFQMQQDEEDGEHEDCEDEDDEG